MLDALPLWEIIGRNEICIGAPALEPAGKDSFHRVPDFARKEWDAVERVLARSGGAKREKSLSGESLLRS